MFKLCLKSLMTLATFQLNRVFTIHIELKLYLLAFACGASLIKKHFNHSANDLNDATSII